MTRSLRSTASPSTVPSDLQRPAAAQAPAAPHQHGWVTESRHATSDGICVYVRCDDCGARRIDLQERPDSPPRGCSIEVGGTPV